MGCEGGSTWGIRVLHTKNAKLVLFSVYQGEFPLRCQPLTQLCASRHKDCKVRQSYQKGIDPANLPGQEEASVGEQGCQPTASFVFPV